MVGQALCPGHLGLEVWRQAVPPYSSFLYWVTGDRGEIVGLLLREKMDPVVRGHVLGSLH